MKSASRTMNHKARILPLGSPLGRPQKERRPLVRVVVFIVLAVHLVLLAGLLIQGCKHSEPRADTTRVNPTGALPPVVANGPVWQRPLAAATTTPTAPAAAAPPTKAATANRNANIYVVKSGDTLAKIAQTHGTTVRTIRASNRLKSDQIVVGDKLKLSDSRVATAAVSRDSSSQP
jgi:LysM domain-containing protein